MSETGPVQQTLSNILQKSRKKTCRIQTYDLVFFFVGKQHKTGEKNASISAITFFFGQAKIRAENFCSTDQELLKGLRHFHIEFRMFAQFQAFSH